MSGIIRGVILTLVLLVLSFLGLLGWGSWLHSFEGLRFATPSWLPPYEQFIFIGFNAPVLLLLGAFAFWLYEPRQRTAWAITFAITIGITLSSVAPSLALRSKPLLLGVSWVASAALGTIVVLLGSWLSAKLLLLAKRRGAKSAA